MAMDHVEASTLWQKSLASRADDPHAKYRDKLRTAFINMRENVIPFVRNIHKDALGLTVHEESHLDALWQTSSCIAGDEFELTPIEAFVFGASVLLHDTGLAIAAYPGGLAELKETTVWRDIELGALARGSRQSGQGLNRFELDQVLFSTLRKLHAEQAEKLISFTFKRQNREEAIPLLQDVVLHDALGAAIGRIAHSHHWDSIDLPNKLVKVAGTVPGYPAEWLLDELKVACLLRCADAAHIDALRAPTMLFALTNVEGGSLEHWTFQNKLNSVTRAKDKLVYYAGQSFGIDEASSWWLAYDTVQMIDRELKACNAILEEAGSPKFAASGVSGAESPRLLSKTIRVEGWAPVSAEVKVSDPVHLARTLGGRNLYGAGILAPVREILQNAVDAVRARRALQSRDTDWGKIRLIVERVDNENQDVWLHVDDTGTGMSERVVTGPLIDFGKSFWSTSLMDEEFPGLRSSSPKLVGKFGIGFFSIFLLGDAVRVVTRRFDASEMSAVVLSFDELTRRPILRRAATGELPMDYTTRVSVKLNSGASEQLRHRRPSRRPGEMPTDFLDHVVNMIVGVDVDIELHDRLRGSSKRHSGAWTASPPDEFLGEVSSLRKGSRTESLIQRHRERVRIILEDDGTVAGRAALLIPGGREEGLCLVSVGGFSSRGMEMPQFQEDAFGSPYFPGAQSIFGVVIGDTFDASRTRSAITASKGALTSWAREQDSLIDPNQYTPLACVPICHALLKFDVESAGLPFGFLAGRLSTVAAFRTAIADNAIVDVPISHADYRNTLSVKSINELNAPYFTSHLHPTVAVVSLGRRPEMLTEEKRKLIIESGRYEVEDADENSILGEFAMRYLWGIASEIWGSKPKLTVERVDLVSSNASAGSLVSWVVRFSKG